MNSTPSSPAATIRWTALLPPPPTPTTLILAPSRDSGSSVSRSFSASLPRASPCLIVRPPCRAGRSTRLKELFENAAESYGHAAKRSRTAYRLRDSIAMRIEHQPDRCRKLRAVDVIRQSADANRASAANGQIEDLFGNLRHPLENRSAAGEHDA